MKYRVNTSAKTSAGNYTATSTLEAPDANAAWDFARASCGPSERVVSVVPVMYGVWCERLASSQLGPGAEWLKGKDLERKEWNTLEAAALEATRLNQVSRSPHLRYVAREVE